MASLDASGRQRESLPSIINLDFEKYRLDKADHNRYAMPSFSTLSRASMNSPPTMYSGPPPPYSSSLSGSNTVQGMPGYISPPETNSRRSTRDDKDASLGTTSLPSISEALKSAEALPASQQSVVKPPSGAPIAQTFADAPRGPGNPFSQSSAPTSALRSSLSAPSETSPRTTIPPATTEARPIPPTHNMSSPRLSTLDQRLPVQAGPGSNHADPSFKNAFNIESARPGYPFPDYPSTPSMPTPQTSSFTFESQSKPDDSRNPFVKPDPVPYNETVKRHLDIYDAEVALNEIHDASIQTLEFAKVWSQRYHQANRTSYFNDGLPGTTDVEDILRVSSSIMDGLAKLREVAVAQQIALNEQRARVVHGQQMDDEYSRLSDEYKSGGFASGDAKKRRGKAAPPGRCHSCNRAETPEWRRGPDGARTLCNACGLHYAKLTRKMGANKAAVMTGSNLRPKSLTETRP